MSITRRKVLGSTAMALFVGVAGEGGARVFKGEQPWVPFADSPPPALPGGRWYFFTPDEARMVEAIVERLIPADELSISGKDAGCATFIDRQLAGSYGRADRAYMKGPFQSGSVEQGDQLDLTPQQRYRLGLAALDAWCRQNRSAAFADLPGDRRDAVLTELQTGKIALPNIGAGVLFDTLLQNTMEGFFADPIYGGNRDMVSWRMVGFPGARYDYRGYVELHNQKLDLEPLSLAGRAGWKAL